MLHLGIGQLPDVASPLHASLLQMPDDRDPVHAEVTDQLPNASACLVALDELIELLPRQPDLSLPRSFRHGTCHLVRLLRGLGLQILSQRGV